MTQQTNKNERDALFKKTKKLCMDDNYHQFVKKGMFHITIQQELLHLDLSPHTLKTIFLSLLRSCFWGVRDGQQEANSYTNFIWVSGDYISTGPLC